MSGTFPWPRPSPTIYRARFRVLAEASLFGHLKNGSDEAKGSDAYVPPDKQGHAAAGGDEPPARGQPEALKAAPARHIAVTLE